LRENFANYKILKSHDDVQEEEEEDEIGFGYDFDFLKLLKCVNYNEVYMLQVIDIGMKQLRTVNSKETSATWRIATNRRCFFKQEIRSRTMTERSGLRDIND